MKPSRRIRFDYDHENKILTKKQIGVIAIDEISEAWLWAFDNKIVPEGTCRFLLDYRDAEIKNAVKASESIINFYNKNINMFRGAKFAIVSNNPKNVATTMLVGRGSGDFVSKPFTTIEKAIEWLIQ